MRVRLVRLGITLAAHIGSLVLSDASDSAVTKLEVTWAVTFHDAKFKNFTFIQQDTNCIHRLLFPWVCPHPNTSPSSKCLTILQDATVIVTSFASLLVQMEGSMKVGKAKQTLPHLSIICQ